MNRADWVTAALAAAPPLTDTQRTTITAILLNPTNRKEHHVHRN